MSSCGMELEQPLRRPSTPLMTEDDYAGSVWPLLAAALEALLHSAPRPQSMEVLSRAVFNTCCAGLSDRLLRDLLALIEQQVGTAVSFNGVSAAETRVRNALPIIRGLFGYVDREYADGLLLERMVQRLEESLAVTARAPAGEDLDGALPPERSVSAASKRRSSDHSGTPEAVGVRDKSRRLSEAPST